VNALHRFRFRRDRRGVTLLEVLAVLAIFAILVAMAAPALNGFISRAKRRAVLDGLATDIYYARMMAVRQGRPVRIEFASTGTTGCGASSGYVSFGGYQIVASEAGGDRALKTVDFSADEKTLCVETNNVANAFGFNSRGILAPISQRTIHALSGGRADSLRISLAGRVLRSY
jgi:prepilin-type N-terminal cleavage/methylation domain-containing protein